MYIHFCTEMQYIKQFLKDLHINCTVKIIVIHDTQALFYFEHSPAVYQLDEVALHVSLYAESTFTK